MAVNERDFEFGPEDAKIAALYREAAGEEPPRSLDAAVLRNARSAVATSGREPRAAWWMPWRVPFAFAAVAVLSVSIVLVAEREDGAPMKLERDAPSAEPPPTAATNAAEAPAPLASGSRAEAPPPAREPAPASKTPPEPRARSGAAAPPPAADSARLAESQASAAAEGRASATAKAATEELRADRESSDRLQALAKRRAEDTARAMRDEAAPRPQPPVAMSAPPPPPAAAPAPERPSAAAPAPVERAPAPAARAPAPAAQAYGYAGPEAKPLAQRRAAAADAMTPSVAALVAELDKRPPAEWLSRIAALRREGRTADADGVLAEFKRRFPDEPVPPTER